MEAVMARIEPEADLQLCGIEGCGERASYHLVKMKDNDREEEKYFCEKHGAEYVTRAHLVISENV